MRLISMIFGLSDEELVSHHNEMARRLPSDTPGLNRTVGVSEADFALDVILSRIADADYESMFRCIAFPETITEIDSVAVCNEDVIRLFI